MTYRTYAYETTSDAMWILQTLNRFGIRIGDIGSSWATVLRGKKERVFAPVFLQGVGCNYWLSA